MVPTITTKAESSVKLPQGFHAIYRTKPFCKNGKKSKMPSVAAAKRKQPRKGAASSKLSPKQAKRRRGAAAAPTKEQRPLAVQQMTLSARHKRLIPW